MAIEVSPMLPDRKHLVQCIGEYKQTRNYILIYPLEVRTLRLPYDARAEVDRVEHSLDVSSNAKPMFKFNIGTPEAATGVDSWYDARLAEIVREKQKYRHRLADAEKSGAITTSEANRVLVDLSSPFPTNPFIKARREAEEL